MSAIKRVEVHAAQITYADELQPFIDEALQNPEIRAAYEDATQRHRLLDTLVALRKRLGLTQTEVARRMGVKQPMVSEFENEGSDPRLSTIQRYARAVEGTVRWQVCVPHTCDWLPRADGYTNAKEDHRVGVRSEPATQAPGTWPSKRPQPQYSCNDFVLAS